MEAPNLTHFVRAKIGPRTERGNYISRRRRWAEPTERSLFVCVPNCMLVLLLGISKLMLPRLDREAEL